MSVPGARRWWALAAIVISVLTIGFDSTILNVALPTLAAKIDADNGDLQWIVDSYILIFAGLLLPAGILGDRYGRKRVLLVGLALFGGASILAMRATGPTTLIVARGLMGIGAATITPIVLAIIPTIFEPRERAKAIGVTTIGLGLGVPLGPLLGGYLIEHFWWGSIFLINVPMAALAFITVATLVPESRDPAPAASTSPARRCPPPAWSRSCTGSSPAPSVAGPMPSCSPRSSAGSRCSPPSSPGSVG